MKPTLTRETLASRRRTMQFYDRKKPQSGFQGRCNACRTFVAVDNIGQKTPDIQCPVCSEQIDMQEA